MYTSILCAFYNSRPRIVRKWTYFSLHGRYYHCEKQLLGGKNMYIYTLHIYYIEMYYTYMYMYCMYMDRHIHLCI